MIVYEENIGLLKVFFFVSARMMIIKGVQSGERRAPMAPE